MIQKDVYKRQEKLCADAGYGSFSNYEYCEQKGIQAFIKYPSWNGERTGRNPALDEYVDAVSYTHLDVYKRQAIGIQVKNDNAFLRNILIFNLLILELFWIVFLGITLNLSLIHI